MANGLIDSDYFCACMIASGRVLPGLGKDRSGVRAKCGMQLAEVHSGRMVWGELKDGDEGVDEGGVGFSGAASGARLTPLIVD